MRKFLLRILFSKTERQVIWASVLYSEHTYRRRQNGYAPKKVVDFIDRNSKIFADVNLMNEESKNKEV